MEKKSSKRNIMKGCWTEKEDNILMSLVNQNGNKKWSLIAKQLPGRIGKQCRERWYNHLDPTVNKNTWSSEEDSIIIESHKLLGNHWSQISKKLCGRPANAIKNHWNATLKKKFNNSDQNNQNQNNNCINHHKRKRKTSKKIIENDENNNDFEEEITMEDDEENSTDIDEDNIEEEEENEEDNNNNNKEKEEESDEESDVEIPKKKFEESTREKELEEEILSIRTLTSSPSCSSLDEYFDSENNNFTFDEEEKNIEQLVDQIINHNIIDKLD